MSALEFNHLYVFDVNGVNLSQFITPNYPLPYTIVDIELTEGERSAIEEIPLGSLNSPDDIVFSQRLQTDFIEEIPLGSLNSPLDENWIEPEVMELPYVYHPPDPLYAPLDILASPRYGEIEEIPLGSLNSPLDENWIEPEVMELPYVYHPPDPLYAPLDILEGFHNSEMLMYNLVLNVSSGGEQSYAFIT